MVATLAQGGSGSSLPYRQAADPGGNVVCEVPGNTTAQGTTTTCRYTWAPGLVTSGQIGVTTGVHSVGCLPTELYLGPGFTIGSLTVGLSASTSYSGATLLIVENG